MKDGLNIQEKLQEFQNNSLVIKDFQPKILAQIESYNKYLRNNKGKLRSFLKV